MVRIGSLHIYHLKTLFWTYLVWAPLSLLVVLGLSSTTHPLTHVLHLWGLFHIVPLALLVPPESLAWPPELISCGIGALAIVVAGLLVEKNWARGLIIAGMILWFLVSFVVFGTSV
jgi:hypothetical protein